MTGQEECLRAPALRRELSARGLVVLGGVTRRAWEEALRAAGVPAERHMTGQPDGHPFEPVEEEVWVPEWVGRVAVATSPADPELQRAVEAEARLGGGWVLLFELMGAP